MLSKKAREVIQSIISRSFDNLKGTFLGPSALKNYYSFALKNYDPKKSLLQAYLHANLLNGMQDSSDKVNMERLQNTASDYIDSLKQKTTADMMRTIEEGLATVKNKNKLKSEKIGDFLRTDEGKEIFSKIRESLEEQRKKLDKGVELIANVELHNAQNHGVADAILKSSEQLGIEDPLVCKIGVNDDKICKDCIRLWVQPDMVTPKVYKMSELASDSGDWKDRKASISTTHPNCRHVLVFVGPGFGFNKAGRLEYVGQDHNEYDHQKKQEKSLTKK
jgi:hypothetical protein